MRTLLALAFAVVVVLGSWLSGQNRTAPETNASSGQFDGPAELPRELVKTSLADTPAPGKTRVVHADDDLERAIDQANCGDTLKLEAGATFTGKFVFPAKNCDDGHWIILRSSAPDAKLPPDMACESVHAPVIAIQ